jgi:hypothetical protein
MCNEITIQFSIDIISYKGKTLRTRQYTVGQNMKMFGIVIIKGFFGLP